MAMKTSRFQQILWIVIVFIGPSGPAESLTTPVRLVEIQQKPSVTKAGNTHYLPFISQPTTKIPVAYAQAEASSSDDDKLMRIERLGEFKIGSSAVRILEFLSNPQTKSKNIFSEADGLYRQSWYYPKQGVIFEMVAENNKDKPKVAAIKISSPSKFKTDRSIKIGDSYDKVVRVYGRYKDKEHSVPFKRFVAGSVYGGLIFSFQNGRVVEIFLGAAAE